jgi:hypothetical protein
MNTIRIVGILGIKRIQTIWFIFILLDYIYPGICGIKGICGILFCIG